PGAPAAGLEGPRRQLPPACRRLPLARGGGDGAGVPGRFAGQRLAAPAGAAAADPAAALVELALECGAGEPSDRPGKRQLLPPRGPYPQLRAELAPGLARAG